MAEHQVDQPDYGTGQKKLSIYLVGILGCAILTLVSFWIVMASHWSKWAIFTCIYSAACVQFFLQLICFIRINTETKQGKTNVMTLLFTGVVLLSIIAGSLWIMSNLNYNMMH
jgi:cytochrome o ubiquinol oxidase operon protein cyoD